MNYAKVISSAIQLFPKKIKVILIDAVTGNNLGKHKIPAGQLPAVFNRPTIIDIENISWRVLKADPVSADDFLYSKRLVLHVRNAASIEGDQLRFNVPSVCADLPATDTDTLDKDFTVELAEMDWRQIEFIPLSQAGIVEEAVSRIEDILATQPNPLLGYEQQYIRANILRANLTIPFGEFCSLLANPAFGNIALSENKFVQGGFAVRSESYTYYGIQENGTIHTLCLAQFEWADDEFMSVLAAFDLLLIDWCNASRFSAEPGEKPQSEFVKL